MIQKGGIKLDEKKLGKEDRRYLISELVQRYVTNEQMKLSNRSLFISIIALLLALVAIIVSLDFIDQTSVIVSGSIIIILFVIIFSLGLKKSNKKIGCQLGGLNSTYSNLFQLHFKHAIIPEKN